MKVWIWPLSWHRRIKALEIENAALRAVGLELQRKLSATVSAHAIAETATMACYLAAVSGMASSFANYPSDPSKHCPECEQRVCVCSVPTVGNQHE